MKKKNNWRMALIFLAGIVGLTGCSGKTVEEQYIEQVLSVSPRAIQYDYNSLEDKSEINQLIISTGYKICDNLDKEYSKHKDRDTAIVEVAISMTFSLGDARMAMENLKVTTKAFCPEYEVDKR